MMLDERDMIGPVPRSICRGLPIVSERLFPFSTVIVNYFEGALRDQFSPSHNYIAYVPTGVVRQHNKPSYFHYTKLDNFKNIINSGVFWASELGKMNDAEEITYAKDRFIIQLSNIMQSHRISLEYQRRFIEVLEDFFQDKMKSLYCVSLSKRGNLLSQWVKYSQEKGVSFSLNSQLLDAIPNHYEGAKCVEVIYSIKEQHIILLDLAQRLITSLRGTSSIQEVRRVLDNQYAEEIRHIVCAIKNPSFAEEEELRIIIPGDKNQKNIKTRPGGKSTYLELNYMNIYKKNPSIDLLIEWAFCAPTRDEMDSLNKIYKIMSHKKIKFCAIIGSGSSYIWPNTI
ncbi:TPA: DUF2971 domain-containing protein [Klebsiella variicola subsp. variicola]|nr:DUF2971 domain-containing protein [Klebsiella variicola subsp. variicola]